MSVLGRLDETWATARPRLEAEAHAAIERLRQLGAAASHRAELIAADLKDVAEKVAAGVISPEAAKFAADCHLGALALIADGAAERAEAEIVTRAIAVLMVAFEVLIAVGRAALVAAVS